MEDEPQARVLKSNPELVQENLLDIFANTHKPENSQVIKRNIKTTVNEETSDLRYSEGGMQSTPMIQQLVEPPLDFPAKPTDTFYHLFTKTKEISRGHLGFAFTLDYITCILYFKLFVYKSGVSHLSSYKIKDFVA